MIWRKISEKLEDFYKANGRYALLVDGARQIDMNFGAKYENVVAQELCSSPCIEQHNGI